MVDLNLNMDLPPPSFFEELNQQTTQQQINTLSVAYPELSQDEIVAYVEFYSDLGIPFNTDALQNLLASDPILTEPRAANTALNEIVASTKNIWFSPNPFATFFILFLELQAKLTEIKVAEAEVMSTMINLTLDMAEDLAGIIHEIYENEAWKAIASGICNFIGGLASVGFGIAGLSKIGGGAAGIAQAQSLGAIGGGIGQISSAIDKFVTAGFDFRRADLEYSKTIIENALKVLQDRGMASASEAQRTADELIAQILQKLDKIIDEAYRAHGFQVH
ncbi:hypothetical protein [Waddlia chondrophila]|uniref:Uncharacterized protein n=1 Tax=Waddlia chondrophila (strain ATCC VR-1470 / WSU 86-1044) TaxID=716544 RepID=D6YSA9_WADCW|nr:hypothetical protein [Waddlia chondrophila]ADI38954.1 hypothetical protein wcw_1609 [Waddlia chondrophila WSU 86-1044]